MKGFLNFLAVCAYVVGVIGGLGWTLYSKAYFIAVCVAVLAVMAFPQLKRCIKGMK